MSATSRQDAGKAVIAVAASLFFIFLVLFGLGLFANVKNIIPIFTVLAVVAVVIGFIGRRTADISIGFTVVTFALIVWIADAFLPDAFLQSFAVFGALFREATGIHISQIDPTTFLVLSTTFTVLVIGLRLWLQPDNPKFARPIIEEVLRTFGRYINLYITTGRLIALFVFAVGFVIFQNAGQFLGEVGALIQQVPFVASNLWAILVGFMALGGQVPVLSDILPDPQITATLFLILTGMIVIIAAMTRFEASGPLSQFLNRLS